MDDNFHEFLASIARVYPPTEHDEMQAKQLIGRAKSCYNFLGRSDFCGLGGELKWCSLIGEWRFPCRNCGGGDRGGVAIYRPFGEFRRAKIALSPVWCSRPTTGVPLAHATMNFVGLDLTTSD
ncbi:hypothetical protein TNCV_2275251, partial [Trichonephila clavipes]